MTHTTSSGLTFLPQNTKQPRDGEENMTENTWISSENLLKICYRKKKGF